MFLTWKCLTFTLWKYSHNLLFVSIKNVYLNKKRNYLIIHSYFHLHQQCSLLWQTWYKIQNAVHLELMAQGSIVQLNAESKHGFDLIPFRLSSVLGHQMCVAFSKQIAYMTIKLPFMKSSCCIRQAHTTGAPKRRVYLSNSIVWGKDSSMFMFIFVLWIFLGSFAPSLTVCFSTNLFVFKSNK